MFYYMVNFTDMNQPLSWLCWTRRRDDNVVEVVPKLIRVGKTASIEFMLASGFC